jgi:competence protein ComEA
MMPHLKKNRAGSGFLLLIVIVLGIHSIKVLSPGPGPMKGIVDGGCYIQVSGRVKNPGVHTFDRPPGVGDALNRAGGKLPAQSIGIISNASTLKSGTRLDVYFDGNQWILIQGPMSAFYKMTLGLPISLNQETEEGLTAIPGIGEKTSRAIIEERRKRGGFADINELLTIDGIGEGLLKKIVSHADL